ncbi:Cysteine-rich receptor-like protein [Vigna angularis]|uniref:Cysteine-rich receptor-like protein n=1 Tax=Phaseolus angularis TaxID=3914 RepID=A0A8T0KA16_PHAAN|nr:Cysteine-rich receptor-like protein [Vigna angularis]
MMKPNLLVLILIWCCTINIVHAYGSVANPQTHFLNQRCSKYNASNLRSFFGSINESFSRLRDQVNNHRKHFVTAESQARGKILTHTMFQCRNYLSRIDCLACFNTASTQIRNCSSAKAARVIYDGCFLRYERGRFYNQTTEPDNGVSCGNMSSNATSFKLVAEKVLMELQTTTAKTKGFYAATKTEVAGGSAIYAIAQCVETATEDDCLQCMTVGYNNLQSCLPNTEGRAYDAGCFVRYSTTPFFADNQTIDITPYLDQATKATMAGGGAIYAVAQCVETAAENDCLRCMQVGYNNLQSCLPNTEGRAYDAGCFMRYSTTPFFPDNQTIDITPYLKRGGSRKKWIIVGVVVGSGGLLLIILAVFAFRRSRKPKRFPREDEDGREYLLQRAWGLYERGMQLELVDEAIDPNEYDAEEAKKIIEIALLCTQASAATRPTMSEAVVLLKSKSFPDHLRPTMPVFVVSSLKSREDNSRYESNDFFDQIFSRSSILCGNQTADGSTDFGAVGEQVLIDLRIGTPKIRGYFAATKTKVAGGAIYAFAQCAETLSQDTCLDCLSVEQSSIQGCLPSTEGRAFDPGCFMRYSETPFFADNQTIDISPFLKQDRKVPREFPQAWDLYEKGMELELVDKSLGPNSYDIEELKKVIGIALLCTQPSAGMRPAMSEVVVLLSSNDFLEDMRPSMPIFIESNGRPPRDISASTASSVSNASASNSIVPAR